jgi:hypothetical protein
MKQNFAAIILGGTGQVGGAAVAELLTIPEYREVVRSPESPLRRHRGCAAPREWGNHPHHPEGEDLITRGAFGPILSVVFVAATHGGGFTWSGWERGSAGTLAVFRHRVPKEQSHYSVGTHGLSGDKEMRRRSRDITAKWRSIRPPAQFCI